MRMRLILCLGAMALLAVSAASAGACSSREECEAQRALSKRRTHATGGPDPQMVCFRVLMRDPRLGLRMTIKYPDGRERTHEYPVGSAQHAAGSRARLPLFCIEDWKLQSASWAKICTATEGDGGSATFSEEDIHYLLRVRSVPESRPACLMGGEAWCGPERPER